jgi:Tfp pilus assembly PilM family ATPase
MMLVAGCTHADSESFMKSVESPGLLITRLLPRVVALGSACAPLLTGATGLCALVEMGWDAAIIAVLHEGVIVYARSHENGALTSLLRRFQSELGFSAEAGAQALFNLTEERAPVGAPLASRSLEDAACLLAEHIAEVAGELGASLSYAWHKYPTAGIGHVLVSGPGAALRGTGALLADRFENPLRVVNVTDVALIPACMTEVCSDPALLVAVGLAAHSMETGRGGARL